VPIQLLDEAPSERITEIRGQPFLEFPARTKAKFFVQEGYKGKSLGGCCCNIKPFM
jgi:hypothetical protein